MWMRTSSFLTTVLLLAACGGGDEPGESTPGNDTRPSNTTCIAGSSTSFSGVRLVTAFPNLTFSQPIAMIPAPTGNTVYVLERSGRVQAFVNDPATMPADVTEFADISASISTQGEGGLLGMAFDPDFATNGYVYFSYTAPVPAAQQIPEQRVLWSRISRFATNASRTQVQTGTETILLQIDQPYANHNGGQIAFDNNGHLFIGLGDGGSGNDPRLNGQNTSSLLGAMLRIDPSQPDNVRGLPYSIPAGNPFSTSANCDNSDCPEIYAWGLRNPWRWSFDRSTFDLWVGDVGQSQREEVDLILAGLNYGWACYEGTRFNSDYGGSCSPNLVHQPPVFEYGRSDGNSITGGYVYRGTDIPSLIGSYVFTDYGSGTLWALANPYSNPQRSTLTSAGGFIASMAEDANGELYTINIVSGEIQKLEPDPNTTPILPFATMLSQTGCADSTDSRLATSGMIPYELNAPLWSDNASKQRWLALPDNTSIEVNINDDWEFPPGSVLRKDFYLNGQIVETRLLAHHIDGNWAGYSYEWDDTQTDATLLSSEKTISVQGQDWTFPSQAQCLQCHTSVAGRALGPETAQLNREITDPRDNNQINQLSYLDAIGMFSTTIGSPGLLPRLTEYNDALAQPLDIAKSYLHSNCSHCHQAGGTAPGDMDLHYATPLAGMNLCNVAPGSGQVLGATVLVSPNNLGDSILYQRMREMSGTARMPPVGTAIEDPQGLQLVSDWITSFASCP
jgi:uncharacterized repeat protein (TIGR03806 family)